MNKYLVLFLIVAVTLGCKPVIEKEYEDPETRWGELYKSVKEEHIFEVEKQFWDAVPKGNADNILKLYEKEKNNPDFNLKDFLYAHFDIPDYSTKTEKSDLSFEDYVHQTFSSFLTQPKTDGGSLIGTRMYYTTGGGPFQEYNYFTSFFALKAYQALGEDSLAQKMGTNAFQFIQDYGYVPYGNRTYFLGYSGLPMLSLMAETMTDKQPDLLPWIANLMAKLYQNEMAHHVDDKRELKEAKETHEKSFKTVVFLEDDSILNRYYSESKGNQFINLTKSTQWADTDRFRTGGQQMPEHFIPVDLNALMFQFERILAKAYESKNQNEYANSYINLSEARRKLIDKYIYDDNKGFYYDFNFETGHLSVSETLAAIFPIVTGLASQEQSAKVITKIKSDFFTSNGVLDDLSQNTGSAEMNYLTILALRKAGEIQLASELKEKWIALNKNYFEKHGYLLQRYNLINPDESPLTRSRMDGALGVLVALLNE